MNREMKKKYREFMDTLEYCEQPLAAYYSDKKPAVHTGPEGGFFVDIKKSGDILSLAGNAEKLQQQKKEKYRCMFQFLTQTRKKHIPSVFDHDNYGCPGCRFYLGFVKKLPRFNHFFISTGIPVLYKGERFAPTPASSKRHAGLLEGIRQKGSYVIFEQFENMSSDIKPELVIFFCNVEILSGLITLIRFVTDESDAVQSPFAAGCASLFSWPMKYKQEGLEKAVLGVFDPAARPYLSLGEMTLSIPYSLFKKMLSKFKKSFLYKDKIKNGFIKKVIPGWPEVRKRAGRLAKKLLDLN